jgi:hypothetical protein
MSRDDGWRTHCVVCVRAAFGIGRGTPYEAATWENNVAATSADLWFRSAALIFKSSGSHSAGQCAPWGKEASGYKPRSGGRMWPMAAAMGRRDNTRDEPRQGRLK